MAENYVTNCPLVLSRVSEMENIVTVTAEGRRLQKH